MQVTWTTCVLHPPLRVNLQFSLTEPGSAFSVQLCKAIQRLSRPLPYLERLGMNGRSQSVVALLTSYYTLRRLLSLLRAERALRPSGPLLSTSACTAALLLPLLIISVLDTATLRRRRKGAAPRHTRQSRTHFLPSSLGGRPSRSIKRYYTNFTQVRSRNRASQSSSLRPRAQILPDDDQLPVL